MDDRVTYLVDHRELYFVPVVNPDGYAYNELTDRRGWAMEKNRLDIVGSSCVGVTLTGIMGMNLAITIIVRVRIPVPKFTEVKTPFLNWNPLPYGTYGISSSNSAFSIHSTAGSYLMPYGFDTNPPAYEIYSEWASEFLSENDYPYGVTFQMLGYTSCGTTRIICIQKTSMVGL